MGSKYLTFLSFLSCGLLISGCDTTTPNPKMDLSAPLISLKSNKRLSPVYAQIIEYLEEGEYKKASSLVNLALQREPRNSAMHSFNGLIYEKLAETGDTAGYELAAVGYQNAVTTNPSNVFALVQLGKVSFREKKYEKAQENFANALLITPNDANLWHELAAASYYSYDLKSAVAAISKAEKLNPSDPLINRSACLIYAAAGEFDKAKEKFEIFKSAVGNDKAAITHVQTRLNDWSSLYKSGRIIPAAASTSDSTSTTPLPAEVVNDKTSTSEQATTADGNTGSDAKVISSTADKNSSDSSSSDSATKSSSESSSSDGSTSSDGSSSFGSDDSSEAESSASSGSSATTHKSRKGYGAGPSADDIDEHVVIDCYLLRVTENVLTSKGHNILENLAVTFNPGGFMTFKGKYSGSSVPPLGSASSTNSFSYQNNSGFRTNQHAPDAGGVDPAFAPSVSTFTFADAGSFSGRIFTAGVTWAGLTYDLNIANAIDSRTRVISRPTLSAFLNKKTSFFSGDELVAGFSGQFGGSLVKYQFGITVNVTPIKLEGDMITMNIEVEGSLIQSPKIDLQSTLDVGKATINTTVKMKMGETFLLGGLYESIDTDKKEGFPGLQDIPLLQYFFSKEETFSSRRTVMAMLTPRSRQAVRNAATRAAQRGGYRPHMDELATRNHDWFHPWPNMVGILNSFSQDPSLYFEFRTGDILPPSWGWETSIHNKLELLKSFLYF